jgi:hypothetical protein
VDGHVRLQQPRPQPHMQPQHDATRRVNQERPQVDHPPQGQAYQGDPHMVTQDHPQAEHPPQGQAHRDAPPILHQEHQLLQVDHPQVPHATGHAG